MANVYFIFQNKMIVKILNTCYPLYLFLVMINDMEFMAN